MRLTADCHEKVGLFLWHICCRVQFNSSLSLTAARMQALFTQSFFMFESFCFKFYCNPPNPWIYFVYIIIFNFFFLVCLLFVILIFPFCSAVLCGFFSSFYLLSSLPLNPAWVCFQLFTSPDVIQVRRLIFVLLLLPFPPCFASSKLCYLFYIYSILYFLQHSFPIFSF